MRIFLDTSFVIALNVLDDEHNGRAVQIWDEALARRPVFFTTTYVFSEIVTFFNVISRHRKAVEVGELMLNSSSLEIISVDSELFREAWRYMKRDADKKYSFTDCLSFAVMRKRGIDRVLAFDNHFKQAGFAVNLI